MFGESESNGHHVERRNDVKVRHAIAVPRSIGFVVERLQTDTQKRVLVLAAISSALTLLTELLDGIVPRSTCCQMPSVEWRRRRQSGRGDESKW